MIANLSRFDRQIGFLREEATRLRERYKGVSWAEIKAERYDEIAETLREVRQDLSMRGMKDERIG